MVSYIKSDLEFILQQIKISEQHAAGVPLFGESGLIPSYNISWGLRTVDGTYNHLLPGQEQWGAADNQFPELLTPAYRPADGTSLDMDGPGPAPPMSTAPNYNPSNNPNSIVVDASLRTISNLIVDQTLGNPAAILAALERAGIVDPANLMTVTAEISAAYEPIEPLFEALTAAEVAAAAATAAAAANPGDAALQQVAADAEAARAEAEAALTDARDALDALLDTNGIELDGANVSLLNVAPDEGLSAPFNSWFTLFGQFFDHGLDLVNKGGSGTVFIPLQPDDPLYDPTSPTNFMVLTRATVSAGDDGVMGTADDVRPVNTTTAYVDQNQTYTSHSSHQVFLREYEFNAAGDPVSTGRLIEGNNGGMATWADVKAQARDLLGITLTDQDVGNVPLLRTDAYGNFIPGPDGFPQVIFGIGADNIPNTADDIVQSGTPASPVSLVGAVRTGHAFLADIAHNAVPDGLADGDIEIGLANTDGTPATDDEYDNELLDAHYIAGDGRANENIGLTAVHHVFHSEHNRLAEHTKAVVLATGDLDFINEWLAVDLAALPTPAQVADLVWDGERIFQAAKFGTEMQYQHLVFEEFARKIQPNINVFLVPDGFDTTIDPSIVAEFAHVVYRFGHSMLTELIDRFDPNFTQNDIGLIEGFLNPIQFDTNGTDGVVSADIAAGAIVRGMTRQVGNEIDEFVTSALRNNLLGLPLDLATINLARGRDTGVPSLNAARRDFYEASNENSLLKPYESWVDFAGHLKHEASIINFVAAYGTHSLITSQTTIEGRRDAALTIITGVSVGGLTVPDDAVDFLNATGAYAGGALGGLENVDLWIGGLAEEIMPFGGMLGSTFNFVFEMQMESLQNGDRFYYLQRLDGLHLFGEMEGNSFAALIMRNTDATHLPSDVFSTPGLILEVDRTKQYNPGLGETAGADGILLDDPGTTEVNEAADNLGNDPTGGGILTPLVIRNNPATPGPDTNYLRYTGDEHVVLGGTNNADILIASIGDDTLFGDGGNDRLEGGFGNDIINADDGDDIISDAGGDDNIKAGAGNDVVNSGPGLDLVMGGAGQDFIFLGTDMGSEVFAGEGNDFIFGNKNAERILGNEGDDWIETGTFDGAPGDNFDEVFARDEIDGHDVFLGDGGVDEYIGEGGDDIMVGSAGAGKMLGMSGFDWATYKDNTLGTNADLLREAFDATPVPAPNTALDVYEAVEGLSGSRFDDVLAGTDDDATARLPLDQGGASGFRGSMLTAEGIARITGLQAVVGTGVTSFSAGDIILGGDGNDTIIGRGGDDIIDGDKWLNVRISVRQNADGTGPEIESHNSMTTLASKMFAGTINPVQLQIVREILSDTTPGDIDTAVFSGNLDEYTFGTDAQGRMTISHTGGAQTDGTDTIIGIERLQFADQFVSLMNEPATGAPAISDTTPTEGSVLTATVGSIADPNGFNPASVTYQWQVDPGTGFVNIAGATNATFTPTQAQVNQPLRVVASFIDADGFSESLTSAATVVVGDLFAGTAGIDNVTGTAGQDNLAGLASDDILNGGAENDILNGGAGNDTLDGGTGNDAMTGGANDDTYVVDAAGDTVIEAGGGGTDTVQTTLASYTLGANVENLTRLGTANFSGTGNTLNNTITGGTGNDTLNGGDGNDTLNGGAGVDTLNGGNNDDILNGGAGADGLAGGLGNDTYVVDNAGDTILEGAGAGTDTVQVSGLGSYTLSANLENLTNLGTGIFTGTGNASANVMLGGSGNDTLNGLAGDDTLNGGAGNDTMAGGADNDTYVVDSAGDIVTEAAGAGTDTVQASTATYTLGANVENLTLTLATGATGTGNGLANIIIGGAGNDTLNGLAGNDTLNGGAGNDTMAGGADNDTYVVDSAGDVVTEAAGAGTDTVESSASTFTLGANVENLTLTGTADINGLGNALANVINGNSGANQLFGGGGTDTIDGGDGIDLIDGGEGNDTLSGGTGNDADVIIGGAGNDTIDVGNGNDVLRYTGVFGDDVVNNFDATGGSAATQDLIDLSALGITAATFATRVVESTIGGAGNTLLTIREGGAGSATQGTIRINGITNANIDATDFILASNPTPITGTAAGTTIPGTGGNDIINALGGNDTVNAGNGNDTITGGTGDDILNGDAGDDIFIWNANAVAPTDGRDIVNGGTESTGGDMFVINGNASAEAYSIYTRAAWVALGGGNTAAAGTEIVVSRNGTNNAAIIAELTEIEEIRINGTDPSGSGTAGGDTFAVVGDFSGTSLRLNTVTIAGTNGNDTVDISNLTSDHSINYTSNGGSDTLVGDLRPQDVVNGTLGAQQAPAPAAAVNLVGTQGKDVLVGGSGADTITGNGGNDQLQGNAGNDVLDGNAGTDTAVFSGPVTNYSFSSPNMKSIVVTDNVGTDGADTLTRIELVTFGNQNFNLVTGTGTGGSDLVLGFNGDDMLRGKGGADVLFGGAGADHFQFDTIGESGAGVGNRDIILDFTAGVDDIDLSAIDARANAGGNQDFTFIGTAAFTAAGQVRYASDGQGNTIVQANVGGANGNAADFEVMLHHFNGPLQQQDFLL